MPVIDRLFIKINIKSSFEEVKAYHFNEYEKVKLKVA